MFPFIGTFSALLALGTAIAPFEAPSQNSVPEPIELSFKSGSLSFTGQLHLPRGNGTYAAVVLIHGSGAALAEGWPYKHHAESFAAAGVAAFVFDKRGTGKSQGVYRESIPFDTLAADVSAAVAAVRAHPAIDPKKVGVWGRSQGAWIAALVAHRDSQIAFAIPVVGGGVTPMEQGLFAREGDLLRGGAPQTVILRMRDVWLSLWTYLATGVGRESAQHRLDQLYRETWFSTVRQTLAGVPPNGILPDESWVSANRNSDELAFFRDLDFDPARLWQTVRIPVLAILGGKDTLTPTESSAVALRRALEEAGSPRSRVVVFPNADHLMCVADASAQMRRGCTFVDGYQSTMAEWIKTVVPR